MAIGIRDGRERGEQAQEHGIPRAMPDRLSTATRTRFDSTLKDGVSKPYKPWWSALWFTYVEGESCCLFSPTVSQKPVPIPSPQQHERRLPSQSSHLVAKDETACAASAFAAQRWPLPGTAVIVPPSSHRARRDAAVSLKEEETGLVVTETRGFLQCPRTHPTTAAESRQDAHGASIAIEESIALTELRGSDSEFLVVAVKVCV
ncbi:hypothetical protein K456DRAFT_36587 [Colletotrichum gloeosporioides 23]|nr:hypothetical protein K456DRAFT_36587 [Colletotrichum gloeosporioides 23]